MRLCTILPLIFLGAAATAEADVVTNIAFLSPSTIEAGGAVTVDLSVKFNPLPEAWVPPNSLTTTPPAR